MQTGIRDRWRLIDSGIAEPAYTMAVDEALLVHAVRTKDSTGGARIGTLHLYSRDPPAVSLGYFQKVKDEVRMDLCRDWGVRILRRSSGGGAIYTDNKQIIYGLVIAGEAFGSIKNSFNIISRGTLEALRLFGLNGEIRGLNDIVINGKKISGCAQTRKNAEILQHGTILIDLDLARITALLTPSALKFSDKPPGGLSERLTSLSALLGHTPTHEEVKQKIILGFEKAFNVKIEPGTLSVEEQSLVLGLLSKKYNNPEWNYRR